TAHLPTSERAVARGASGDIARTVAGKAEVGALAGRRRVAPRPAALGRGQVRAVRARFAQRRGLPFGLGGQPALAPVAVGLRLIPVAKGPRPVRRHRFHLVVPAPRPAAALIVEPVDRMLGGCALAPFPTWRAPEFPPAVAALLYERGERGVSHSGLGDAERC